MLSVVQIICIILYMSCIHVHVYTKRRKENNILIFTGAIAMKNTFTENVFPFHINDINCTGSEDSLFKCPYNGIKQISCTSTGQDVSVVCQCKIFFILRKSFSGFYCTCYDFPKSSSTLSPSFLSTPPNYLSPSINCSILFTHFILRFIFTSSLSPSFFFSYSSFFLSCLSLSSISLFSSICLSFTLSFSSSIILYNRAS